MAFAEGSEQNEMCGCLERHEKHTTSKWKLSYSVKDHDVCSLLSCGSKNNKTKTEQKQTTTKTHNAHEQNNRDKAEE